MKRSILLIGSLLAAAIIAAPASAKPKTTTKTTTVTTSIDNYNGFHSYSGAEHGGVVSTKTKGNAFGVGGTSNAAVANSGAVGGGGAISGNVGPVNVGIGGSAHVGYAQTGANSGSTAMAGSAGNGSSRVETGGYAAGGAGVRTEWGTSTIGTTTVTTTRN